MARDAAWYYPTPSSAAGSIAGRIAFRRGVEVEDEGRGARRHSLFDRFRRRAVIAASGADGPTELDLEAARHDALVADVDDASFFAALDGHVTVADCWAPWCGSCETLHPIVDAPATEHAGDTLRFVRVNVDDSPGVAAAFNLTSIPTIIVFDAAGHEIDRQIGSPSRRRLEQLVGDAASLAAASGDRWAA